MPPSSDSTKYPDSGFSLIELLVAMVISMILVAGFTGFYLSEQRAFRHHQIEVETSQALRTALEEMSRDLRSARRDLINYPNNVPTFLTLSTSEVEFELDANDDGVVTLTRPPGSIAPIEHKGFRLTVTTLEQYDDISPGTWRPLATNISNLALTYRACDQTVTTDPNSVAAVDISITATSPNSAAAVGGLPVTRTETEKVRLRNKAC